MSVLVASYKDNLKWLKSRKVWMAGALLVALSVFLPTVTSAAGPPPPINGRDYIACVTPDAPPAWGGCKNVGTSTFTYYNNVIVYAMNPPQIWGSSKGSNSGTITLNYRQQKDKPAPLNYPAYQVRLSFKNSDGVWSYLTTLTLPAGAQDVPKTMTKNITVPTGTYTHFLLQWYNDAYQVPYDSNLQIDNMSFGPVVDAVASSTPANMRLFQSKDNPSSVNRLVWDASTDNVGVINYAIYANNVLVGYSSGDTQFMIKRSLHPTGTYTVRAMDAASNESAPSASILFR